MRQKPAVLHYSPLTESRQHTFSGPNTFLHIWKNCVCAHILSMIIHQPENNFGPLFVCRRSGSRSGRPSFPTLSSSSSPILTINLAGSCMSLSFNAFHLQVEMSSFEGIIASQDRWSHVMQSSVCRSSCL